MTPGSLINELHQFFLVSAPDMPPESWWVAVLVLFILGTAAAIDAFTSKVPDPLIFFGAIGLVAAQGMYVSWPFAAHQLTFGLIAAAIIWGINELWRYGFKYDALGLGDAKWSMLAVAGFGAMPVLFAWGVGAIVGTVWIGSLKMLRCPVNHVHFAPFLFFGLVAGVWWLRMGGDVLFTFHAP